ncbi:phage tail domain-containing protein [Streptomyces sp. NPDC048281]|uniref:phage tail domain-containing protein n=1 Tax=Streptomyces sp. NPDC048281 TaxID=3154715 RepID=UPI003424D4DB
MIGNNGQGEPISLTSFSDRGWPSMLLQPGATGLDMPPFALFSDDSPNLDGSIYRSARASAREIMIPVYLYGIDRQTINQLKRKLFQALNPKRGYCLLRFTEGNHEARQLTCYYKGGMEGAEGTDTSGFTWAKYGLSFTAMDPWFYPDRQVSARWDFGTGAPLLSSSAPFFPMRIMPGVMGGAGTGLVITNEGDIEAWPIWTLKGPIKSFTLISPYGETIRASTPSDGSDLVPTGRTLTIDTRPGYKLVQDDLGTNYWAKLDAAPQFWSVEPGDTTASVSVVSGAGKAAVILSFTPRYASFV